MTKYKTKRVVIDTNVILDYLLGRGSKSHQEAIKQIYNSSIYGLCEGVITASTLTDLFYILDGAAVVATRSQSSEGSQKTDPSAYCLNRHGSRLPSGA